MAKLTKKVTPFLMFESGCEEAADFYVSLFPNSKVTERMKKDDGPAFSVKFELDGVEFYAFNGGSYFKLSEAYSMFVSCKDQAEVDTMWAKLVEGGTPSRCGWLKDRWGLTWQVVPDGLVELLYSKDPVKAKRAFDAMMTMGKLDIAAIRKAHDEG